MYLDGFIIPPVNSHKHLGFVLDKNLSFDEHVYSLSAKIQKKLNPLKRLSYDTKSYHLNTIFRSFIFPHYDYCDVIYASASQKALDTLDQTYYSAALIVSGCIRGSSTQKVLNILNWEFLRDRRVERQKIYMFKVRHGMSPSYVTSIFQNFVTIPNRVLRNHRPYSIDAHSSSKIRKSPVFRLLDIWNNTRADHRDIHVMSSFKSKTRIRNVAIKMSTVNLKNLNRKEELCLNRLRVDRLLKSHLYSHNFLDVPTPNCKHCKVTCSTSHFLLQCRHPAHRAHIDYLLHHLQDIGADNLFNRLRLSEKVNLLLFGHDSLDSVINNSIILKVSKFIVSYYKIL